MGEGDINIALERCPALESPWPNPEHTLRVQPDEPYLPRVHHEQACASRSSRTGAKYYISVYQMRCYTTHRTTP